MPLIKPCSAPLCLLLAAAVAFSQNMQPGATLDSASTNKLSAELAAKIDVSAQQVLDSTGVPSASLAIVKDGHLAYTHAYGTARLDPKTPATPAMRYSIGSISKQFTAAALLILQQQGKLSIDDHVSNYLPELTRADEVTIRMLLSHTSGYQDYWPEDYLMAPIRQATTARYILDTWGKKPLDFDPGTQWQYSNTNYVIAGQIVEKVSGMPIFKFLQDQVFKPLRMTSVYDSDVAKLGDTDAAGYIRHALGPLHPAPKEGKGWMFAAGELAMPAYELAQWDISILDRSLLANSSYEQMFATVKLKDGSDPHYGLGVFNTPRMGHSALEHSGEVSGFEAENVVFPDDRLAIVVLTNQDASSAASAIARKVAPLLLGLGEPVPNAEEKSLTIFQGLQDGKLDRSLLTPNCNAYFTQQAIDDFASSLKPLGAPASFHQTTYELRGGMTFRAFRAEFANQNLMITTYEMPDGKLEQYLVMPIQ
jgi:D-alanyl-D-alanine carboxypeptidase